MGGSPEQGESLRYIDKTKIKEWDTIEALRQLYHVWKAQDDLGFTHVPGLSLIGLLSIMPLSNRAGMGRKMNYRTEQIGDYTRSVTYGNESTHSYIFSSLHAEGKPDYFFEYITTPNGNVRNLRVSQAREASLECSVALSEKNKEFSIAIADRPRRPAVVVSRTFTYSGERIYISPHQFMHEDIERDIRHLRQAKVTVEAGYRSMGYSEEAILESIQPYDAEIAFYETLSPGTTLSEATAILVKQREQKEQQK